jgi:lipopolysaccharide transport system permease protein
MVLIQPGILVKTLNEGRAMSQHLKELWSYRELVYNLVVRDLKVRYKNSLLGVLWSWLNPLLMMLIFTFVFGYMWRDRPIDNPHILFLSALLPWNFFTGSVMGGIPSIVGNSHLVKKVYFPREALPIAVVLSNLVNFLISLPVLLLLIVISGVPLTGWLFLTPIVYTFRDLPEKFTLLGITFNPQVWLFRLNPMASIINTYQDILYNGTLTRLDFLLRTAVTAFIILVFGYWFFLRFSRRFGEVA